MSIQSSQEKYYELDFHSFYVRFEDYTCVKQNTLFKTERVYYDCDTFIFLLDENEFVLNDDYLVWYNSNKRTTEHPPHPPFDSIFTIDETSVRNDFYGTRPIDPELSVIGPLDGGCHDEFLDKFEDADDVWYIDLTKVHPNVSKILVVRSIYNLGMNQRLFFKNCNWCISNSNNNEIIRGDYAYNKYKLLGGSPTIELFRICRSGNKWTLKVTGYEYGGIIELMEKYVKT